MVIIIYFMSNDAYLGNTNLKSKHTVEFTEEQILEYQKCGMELYTLWKSIYRLYL